MTSEERKVKEWKERYLASRKEEKRNNIIKTIAAALIVYLTWFIGYNWWIDELKFVGRDIDYVYAVVIDEKMIHWGRGYYYQVGNCKYVIDGEKYVSNFRINDYRLLTVVGDTVVLKIVTDNPAISKIEL